MDSPNVDRVVNSIHTPFWTAPLWRSDCLTEERSDLRQSDLHMGVMLDRFVLCDSSWGRQLYQRHIPVDQLISGKDVMSIMEAGAEQLAP